MLLLFWSCHIHDQMAVVRIKITTDVKGWGWRDTVKEKRYFQCLIKPTVFLRYIHLDLLLWTHPIRVKLQVPTVIAKPWRFVPSLFPGHPSQSPLPASPRLWLLLLLLCLGGSEPLESSSGLWSTQSEALAQSGKQSRCFSGISLLSLWSGECWQLDLSFLCLF